MYALGSQPQATRLIDPLQVQRARERLAMPAVQASIERMQKIICEPVRLQMLQALRAGPLCVSDLAYIVDRGPAGASQHLRALRRQGIVEGVRHGRNVRYQLRRGPTADHLTAVLSALENPPPVGA